MKRTLVTVAASLLSAALLAACGGAPAQPAPAPPAPAKAEARTPTIDRIKKEGKLLIGTSPDYPPYEFLDKDNKVVGFDIDLMQAVADKLGVKLEIVQMNFDGLIAALGARKFDIMAAGVSVTEERKQVVDFTRPYIVGKDSLVVHKDNAIIKGLADLKGKKVAVQLGTIQADAMKKVEGVQVKEYNLYTEAAQAVSSKQADALYVSLYVAQKFQKADPNLKIVAEFPSKDTAFALRKDTPDLVAVVNEVLDDLQKSGKFDQLFDKWFK